MQRPECIQLQRESRAKDDMNARVHNNELRQAAENQYLHTLSDTSPRWRPQAGTAATSVLWGALSASTGVILVYLEQLAEEVGELP